MADKLETIASILKKCTFSAQTIIDQKRIIVPVSPVLDDILGGGIQSGSLCIIVGPQKTGKTSTCLHIAKKAQAVGFNIVYLNIEARLSKRDIMSTPGLSQSDNFQVIMSSEKHMLSGEDFIAIADQILATQSNTLLIFDSFSQLISQENLDSDIRDRTRDSIPLILSKFCKRILPQLMIRNNICLGITHEVANTGYGLSTRSETSGKKIQYANNFKLRAGYAEPWTSGDKKKIFGQIIKWECHNSALGPPGRKGNGYLRYNHGLDEEAELVEIAQLLGIIKKSGAWIEIDDKKLHGANGAIEYLRKTPETTDRIRKEVKLHLDS